MSTTRLLATLAAASLAATALAFSPAFLALQPEEEEPATEPAANEPTDEEASEPASNPAATPPSTTTPPSNPATDPATDPEVDRIIEDLERAADRAADTRIAPPPTAATPARLLREGTFLRSRRGRVVRADSGDWLFRFDSDGESPISDPPMVLMPCQALMAMEAIAQRHGDAATFTVSGEVFVYHNRNYLLPKFYVVNRATDEVLPGQ